MLKDGHNGDLPLLTGHLKVLFDPDAKGDLVLTQKLEPLFAHKFAISQQPGDTLGPESGQELFHNRYAFGGIGVALLVQKHPVNRKGDPLVNDTQHQQVDGKVAKLPVGSIQT